MTLRSDDNMQQAVTEIEALARAGCLDSWRQVFGRSPPKHLSLPFMKRVLIWELQCRTLGGVSIKTQRALNRIAAGKPAQATVKPGSQLVREWNGRTYQVDVVEGGFALDGKTYPSLSAVAKRITGAHWSGPRFFGIT